jgi:hypothetical protein
MSKQSAFALAGHLATTPPADSDHDAYMADALSRWPDLDDGEIAWAIKAASVRLKEEGNALIAESEALLA